MPKRPCPFEDDLLPQLKVHVGQKQVDNGVCKEERMKEVYDKTMDLLKEGVKTLSRKLNESTELNSMDVPLSKMPSPCKLKQERNLKQMVLNNKLQLEATDKVINDTEPKYDLCECGKVIDKTMLNKCAYCDQILCTSCLSECVSCSELFCRNCCVPVYDHEERITCLNCFKYA